ncbi:unnamed protein product [Chondrus crispus]|uniref:Uncharacterized protein n=1 Tax=Chondrus crispus TaxID=2769 RepID=R7QQ10_CHOCR|nr:unnamed protein product [Chondrus crispus]CDF39551.1 unnamed protein product [Chondrus crispus]|eukprot:XP_005709845.1 unnamed protein product [Chondrus crispus]
MVLCVPLADVIRQINQFHDETAAHTCVTVVTVFRAYLLDEEEERQLADYVLAELRHPYFRGSSDDLRTVPLSDLPRNVIAGLRGYRLDVAWGQDPWLDTNSADEKIAFLSRTLAATKPHPLRNNLFVLGWTVTPSVLDIAFRVLSLGTLSPGVKQEAVKMNRRFSPFLNDHTQHMSERVNVIFFDCFEAPHAEIVRSLNTFASDTDDSAES